MKLFFSIFTKSSAFLPNPQISERMHFNFLTTLTVILTEIWSSDEVNQLSYFAGTPRLPIMFKKRKLSSTFSSSCSTLQRSSSPSWATATSGRMVSLVYSRKWPPTNWQSCTRLWRRTRNWCERLQKASIIWVQVSRCWKIYRGTSRIPRPRYRHCMSSSSSLKSMRLKFQNGWAPSSYTFIFCHRYFLIL